MPHKLKFSFAALVAFSCFFAANLSLAEEEIICRYCAENDQFMPRGIELSGRYHYAPDRQVDVLHIKIDVTPDFKSRTVSGTTTIKAKVLVKPCDVLRLDAIDLHIKEVRCDGAKVEDFYSTRNDLLIAFAEPVAADTELKLEIDYSAEPQQGLYFRTEEMGYPASDTHIWTQGEPHEARNWFPCFDYPNERSSTEVVCRVPADMTVLSNGKRMGEEQLDGDLKAVRWVQEKPHVSYLICLVAGHLEKLQKQHRDIELGFFTQPTLAKHAANSFADTPEIMAFFEEEIGVPFPWDKYYQVTCADFVAGGMENTSLTTLTQGTIFAKASENISTTRRLDAHEMAHQWFGDYVTCKDWSHLWLNEGFATFYTHLYEGHKFGNDAKLYGLYRDAKGRVLTQKNDTKPIVFNEYKNPRDQFDYRAYPKGSWILHMLRCQLGEDLYRKCIKTYLEKHALGSVTSDDLRQTIEKLSGRSMDRFFDQWVYHARHPDLKISYKWMPKERLAKVTIRQTQKISDNVVQFQFPTKLRFVVDGEVVDHDITVKEIAEDFYLPLTGKPSIVRFDPEFTVLADVAFDKPDDLLKAQIENDKDMIGRLIAAEALAKRKTKASVGLLTHALQNDAFFGVRLAAAKSLAAHESDDGFAALRASMKQDDARIRQRVISQLVGRYHSDTPEIIKEVLATEKNPEIKISAIRAIGRFPTPESRKQLTKFLKSKSFRNKIAKAAISAIRQHKDPRMKDALMDTLETRESEFTARDFGSALSTLAEISIELPKKDDVRRFISSYTDHPKVSVRHDAIAALGKLRDRKATAVLESFSKSDDDRLKKVAADALRAVQETTQLAPREVIDLRKELSEVKKSNEEMKKQWKELQELLKAQETRKKEDAAKQAPEKPAKEQAEPKKQDKAA